MKMSHDGFAESRMTSSPQFKLISIYIDADACPVKQEIYRVAERHARKGTALKGTPLTTWEDAL
jgi:uncharacterized protein